jgi:hypothetical protein
LGTVAFAGVYGSAVEAIMGMWELEGGDTFTDAFGISELAMLGILGASLVAVFYAGAWFERRSQGPVTAEQAVAGASNSDI